MVKIVFDLDNTLTDDFGASLRPGVRGLLESLVEEGHTLVLWTNSKRERAKTVLRDHDLAGYFSQFLFREDYDPQEKGLPKDIRKVGGDLLVDDNPKEIDYVRSIGRKGILVKSFRQGTNPDKGELKRLHSQISGQAGVFSWLKRMFK